MSIRSFHSSGAAHIAAALQAGVPPYWDGKQCVLELQRADYQWRQMEWIGFYFEWKAMNALRARVGGGIGPRFGNMTFDYGVNGQVWDFKAHPHNQSGKWAYTNDVESIDDCLRVHGHIGWIIANGEAVYETDGAFKAWHDALKGGLSDYERERIRTGRPSRKRKVAFALHDLVFIEFRSSRDIQRAREEGWLRSDMQLQQPNADGSPRRAKYGVNVSRWLELNGSVPRK